MTPLDVPAMRSTIRADWPQRWWVEIGGTTYRLYDTRDEHTRRLLAAIFAGLLRGLGLGVCRVRTWRLGQTPVWHATTSVLRPATTAEARALLEAAS